MSPLLVVLLVWAVALPVGFALWVLLGPRYLRRRLTPPPSPRATVIDLAAVRARARRVPSLPSSRDRVGGA